MLKQFSSWELETRTIESDRLRHAAEYLQLINVLFWSFTQGLPSNLS